MIVWDDAGSVLPTCRCFSIPEGILHGSSTPSNHQASAKDLQEPWPDKHLKPCDKFSLFSPRMLLGVIRDCRPINIGVIGLITISKTHSTFYILHTYKHINKYRKNYIYIHITYYGNMWICWKLQGRIDCSFTKPILRPPVATEVLRCSLRRDSLKNSDAAPDTEDVPGPWDPPWLWLWGFLSWDMLNDAEWCWDVEDWGGCIYMLYYIYHIYIWYMIYIYMIYDIYIYMIYMIYIYDIYIIIYIILYIY